jgi:hypothetical protein
LPHHELFSRSWVKTLRRRGYTKLAPASQHPHLIGAAIEIRIGLDLSQSLPYVDLATAVTSTEGRDMIHRLGYRPPTDSDGDLSLWRKVAADNEDAVSHDHDARDATLCWQMAYIETLAHELPKTDLNAQEGLTAIWAHAHPEPPAHSVDLLVNLWRKYTGSVRPTLVGLGELATIRPSFANRFAVGDLLLGDTLIEVKCEVRPEDSLARTLRQVVACALADSDDGLPIKNVGVYHAYEGSLIHWPLEQVLQELTATGNASLADLRARFADTIATERQLIEERGR